MKSHPIAGSRCSRSSQQPRSSPRPSSRRPPHAPQATTHHVLEHDERPGDRDVQDPRSPVRGGEPRHQGRHRPGAVRPARPEVHDRRPGRPGPGHHARRHRPTSPGWAAQGLLTDLTSKVSAADKADFVPAAFGRTTTTRARSGPCRRPSTRSTLFYNKALFKQAGHQDHAAAEDARRSSVTLLPEVPGNGKGIFLRADSYWVQPWIWGYGGGLVDMAKKQILIGNEEVDRRLEAYKLAVLRTSARSRTRTSRTTTATCRRPSRTARSR